MYLDLLNSKLRKEFRSRVKSCVTLIFLKIHPKIISFVNLNNKFSRADFSRQNLNVGHESNKSCEFFTMFYTKYENIPCNISLDALVQDQFNAPI